MPASSELGLTLRSGQERAMLAAGKNQMAPASAEERATPTSGEGLGRGRLRGGGDQAVGNVLTFLFRWSKGYENMCN